MRSIHHLTRHILKLAQVLPPSCAHFLKIQKKIKPLEWKFEQHVAVNNILILVSEITQNKLFNQNLDTRVVWDASTSGLGVALEQNFPEGWVAIAYASQFLNSREEKYSVNELE